MPDGPANAADGNIGEKVEEAAPLTRPDLKKDQVGQGRPTALMDIPPVEVNQIRIGHGEITTGQAALQWAARVEAAFARQQQCFPRRISASTSHEQGSVVVVIRRVALYCGWLIVVLTVLIAHEIIIITGNIAMMGHGGKGSSS